MRPLDGIRILTLEQFAAGPYGTMFLADLGAEVIKIENAAVKGDPGRYVGPRMLGEGDSEYFQTWGSNKKSVTLDLKDADDRAIFHRLVESADAMVNNLRGDQPEKLGLDFASLSPLNPRIVCLHISAYGRDNSRRAWPGYDYLMQAEGGLMSLTGEPDGPPTRCGSAIIDFMTGVTGMVGLLSCLIRARETGEGCDVDASLFDVALHQLSYPGTWHLNGGPMPSRLPRSAHQSIGPVQTVRTKDGWIYIMCMMDKFWAALLPVIGREDLAEDPRFATGVLRGRHRDVLTPLLDEAFMARSSAEWVETLSGVLPVGPVLDVTQALANPFVAEVGMVATVPHPEKADLQLLANPLKINGERLGQRVCSPMGGDNADLLGREAHTTPDAGGDPGTLST